MNINFSLCQYQFHTVTIFTTDFPVLVFLCHIEQQVVKYYCTYTCANNGKNNSSLSNIKSITKFIPNFALFLGNVFCIFCTPYADEYASRIPHYNNTSIRRITIQFLS